ncbi:Trk-type K+ transport system, membrane component [Candidatus Hepatincolaceae symbiont of Richtersius coronifer]
MDINYRLILSWLGSLVAFSAVLIILPGLIDYFTLKTNKFVFFLLFLIVFFMGVLGFLANNSFNNKNFSKKDLLILIFLSWVILAGVLALPFKFSYVNLDYADSYFEAMSAITTTGSTTIVNLEDLSLGMHFYRASLQWSGGLAIIITSLLLGSVIGGMQKMFNLDSASLFSEKIKKIIFGISIVYIMITVITIFMLVFIAKLDLFEATIHSFSAISTTGFINKAGFNSWVDNPMAEFILLLAMFIGGLPYILLYYLFFLRRKTLLQDAEVRGYIKLILILIILATLWLTFNNGFNIFVALRYAAFSIIANLTGAGFTFMDPSRFGALFSIVGFLIMIIGGCHGSTASGVKIFRIQVAYILIKHSIEKLFLKKHISIPIYNRNMLKEDFVFAIFAYFFIFFIALIIVALILSALGVDFIAAFSIAGSSLANVSVGLNEDLGYYGNFSGISDLGKWTLSAAMILGRLDILGVVVLFNLKFWQR